MLRLRPSPISGLSPYVPQYPHTIPYACGSRWDLPSSRRFSSYMPGASDPDRPSEISPCQNFRSMFVFSVLCLVSRQCHSISTMVLTFDSSVLASGNLTPSPPALLSLTRLNRFRVMRHPSGLQDSLCTPHLCCSRLQQYPTIGNAVHQRCNTRYG